MSYRLTNFGVPDPLWPCSATKNMNVIEDESSDELSLDSQEEDARQNQKIFGTDQSHKIAKPYRKYIKKMIQNQQIKNKGQKIYKNAHKYGKTQLNEQNNRLVDQNYCKNRPKMYKLMRSELLKLIRQKKMESTNYLQKVGRENNQGMQQKQNSITVINIEDSENSQYLRQQEQQN